MSEPKIGRVLAAGLHQAINELMPTRVEFYESWLTAAREAPTSSASVAGDTLSRNRCAAATRAAAAADG